jgi:DNA invertase Pin-like site-specific DNA recombinase
MGQRKHKRLQPAAGWAIYMRTSSEDAQNPENSQARQRHAIQNTLLRDSTLPIVGEYIDNLSGRQAENRPAYQRMLTDARAGQFSHVAVENAERFGRNDSEALTAIDELHDIGVAVRFADYPELDPVGADDRIMVGISFTLARRESIKLGQRTRGGLHAKLRSGGFVGKAPDGYRNVEVRTDDHDKSQAGKYTRWVEQDPERAPIWREAWDMLLGERMKLADICEELHARGYYFRSGRPFVVVQADGRRRAAANGLSRIFKNWFYAGWVVSEKAGIQPKQVRGDWEPIVTTDEFERGLAILQKRSRSRLANRRHHYLLKNLLYVQHPDRGLLKLTGSTSNASRSGGGTSYYCVWSSDINIMCATVDRQIPGILNGVQVDPERLPIIRAAYTEEIAERLGHRRPTEREDIEAALRSVNDQEARAARLYAIGKITDEVWDDLWAEWQDRRRRLYADLDALQHQQDLYVGNLDAALTIIAKVGILYRNLEASDQRELLKHMVKRVIVNLAGDILHVELLPPFAYLSQMSRRVGNEGEVVEAPKSTTMTTGTCSDWFPLGVPDET